jgi:hypothetical protein
MHRAKLINICGEHHPAVQQTKASIESMEFSLKFFENHEQLLRQTLERESLARNSYWQQLQRSSRANEGSDSSNNASPFEASSVEGSSPEEKHRQAV